MTLEEAIKHCEEVAKENEYASNEGKWFLPENEVNDIKEQCAECAADHRQLAEWLRELQELREKHWDECRQIALYDDELKQEKLRAAKGNARAVMANMDNLDLKDENRELKKLLKAAIDDMREAESCDTCLYEHCQGECIYRWKHEDEANELLGKEQAYE